MDTMEFSLYRDLYVYMYPRALEAQTIKESFCNAGDLCLISGSGRSPGERNVYSLQYSCLENSMGRGAWWATVPGVAKSHTTEQLTHHHHHTCICSPLNSPSIRPATSHWAEFHVLYSRSLLVIHFKYNSVYMSIPDQTCSTWYFLHWNAVFHLPMW